MHKIRACNIESCPGECYSTLMLTQLQIYRHHIGTSLQLDNPTQNKQELLVKLIHKFGFSFRKFYCTFVCENRYECLVRESPAFNIQQVFDFSSLTSFPQDFSVGIEIDGCHHPGELNAMQVFLVDDFIPGPENENLARTNELYIQETRLKRRDFLLDYGTIFQQMFCSTICPQRIECKIGNHCIPQQYA